MTKLEEIRATQAKEVKSTITEIIDDLLLELENERAQCKYWRTECRKLKSIFIETALSKDEQHALSELKKLKSF